MADIIPFKTRGRTAPKRSVLCVNNHHRWVIETSRRFDVKQGRLVTVERCSRCGKQRNRLS